jgi:putative acyl-CoA dehydrogenase
MTATHEVINQAPPLVGYDVFTADAALSEAYTRHGSPAQRDRMSVLGQLAGSAEARQWAREADTNLPVLRTHDRYGHRIDEVEFHPSWHRLMDTAVTHGLHAAAWARPGPHAHATRAAGFLVWSQVEAAHMCPISMTYAAVPALRVDPAISAGWEPRLTGPYDPGLRPPAAKTGVLAGMAMTEKQGGSDVRANSTRAEPAGAGWYELTGHKWFCSAPMNDVFLVLAQAPDGLSCFVVPRILDDGTRNTFRIQRLKDKLGNRANASAEIEFDGTHGQLLGEEGRGVPTIIEMVAATRLDCILGSTAQMRRAVAEAAWHAAHRTAFGTKLDDAPLMQAVLADLAIETEAATTLAMRLASCVDNADDPHEQALRRIGLPLGKFWVCKRTPHVVAESLECLGGNGYVEESDLPRLYREAPLNSIWEGAGNVQALDLLRVLTREPEAIEAWRTEVDVADDAPPSPAASLRAALADVEPMLRAVTADPGTASRQARMLAGRMVVLLQAALLVRFAPPAVADAFCATRLDAAHGVFGMVPPDVDTRIILDRSTPPR